MLEPKLTYRLYSWSQVVKKNIVDSVNPFPYLRGMEHFTLNMHSGNKKTGFMPVSTSHSGTCPNACPFKVKGCYAKSGPLAIHWKKITEGERGTDWKGFLSEVRKIPKGTLWRHNQAGDLIGDNDTLDLNSLRELIKANEGRKGFTYTHYPLSVHNVKAIFEANSNGLTVNVSTNRIQEVDKAMETGLPVVTVLPLGTEGRVLTTEKGNKVLVCPASQGKEITCQACGLCQKSDRPYAIGFIAHGTAKKNLGN